MDAGGGYTIGAWQTIFNDVAGDLVADLKRKISGVVLSPPDDGGYAGPSAAWKAPIESAEQVRDAYR